MFFHSDVGACLAKRLLCGASLGAIALAIAGPAQAQDQDQGAPQETVSVTGTIIKGIKPAGENLLTVGAPQIKAMGAMTTDDVLSEIPQLANTFNTEAVQPTQINIGAVRPVIRYIPSQAIVGGSETLVLLNGQNMVGISGLATAPDPGMIPTVVLNRVDVLPDGTSSIYGANAITGVINFITRPSYEGFEGNMAVGMADGYTSFNASAIAGTEWSGGGAYLAYEHKSNSYLLAKDRDYTNMNLLSAGGRDSRSTACALPNIKVGNNWYAQTGQSQRPPLPAGCDHQCRPDEPLRHQFRPGAVSQAGAELGVWLAASAHRGRGEFRGHRAVEQPAGFPAAAGIVNHHDDRQHQSLFPVDRRRDIADGDVRLLAFPGEHVARQLERFRSVRVHPQTLHPIALPGLGARSARQLRPQLFERPSVAI
jgi:hypothetical protein